MEILPEVLEFEWDQGNISKNFLKHKVTAHEAEEVFVHEPLLVSLGLKHSERENRYQALGKTLNNKFLFISFTLRDGKIRVISSRNMSRKETKVYEKA